MENWQIEDVCVDSLWYIIYSISSYFNKKVNLMAYIYGEVLDVINNPKTMPLSVMAKKKLFENNVVKYFSAVKDASVKTIKESTTPTEMDIGGLQLNEKGFARLSTLSNVNTNIAYSHKTNKNIYLALGNALNQFNVDDTEHYGKGFFEIVYRYIEKHDNLLNSTPKVISNSFTSNIENKKVVDNLIFSYQELLKKQLKAFQRDMYQQGGDELSVKIIEDVLREVDVEFNLFTPNFSSVVSLNIPRKILLLHGYEDKK